MDINWTGLILGVILTAVLNLIAVLIYRGVNGKVGKQKATKFVLINVIVVCVLDSVIQMAMDSFSGFSIMPAILYFYIGRAIIWDKSLPDDAGSQKNKNGNAKSVQILNSDRNHTYSIKYFALYGLDLSELNERQTHITVQFGEKSYYNPNENKIYISHTANETTSNLIATLEHLLEESENFNKTNVPDMIKSGEINDDADDYDDDNDEIIVVKRKEDK